MNIQIYGECLRCANLHTINMRLFYNCLIMKSIIFNYNLNTSTSAVTLSSEMEMENSKVSMRHTKSARACGLEGLARVTVFQHVGQ